MDVKDFYYDLPQELIAQDPREDRSSSRLLVLDKKTGEMQHKVFKDIVNYLHPGDCLVINDTKVIPARLIGSKEGTDAHIEILLLKRRENDIWETLVKPGKKAKPGTVINFGDGLLKGTVIDVVEEGNRLIQFSYEGIFEEILDQLGDFVRADEYLAVILLCRYVFGFRSLDAASQSVFSHRFGIGSLVGFEFVPCHHIVGA